MDSKKKDTQKSGESQSKPATRPGAGQTHSGTSIERQEGERVQAPKQDESKKTGHEAPGKKHPERSGR